MSHCFLRHPVRVERVVRRGRERHVHGHLLGAPAGAYATVAAASCRPIVHRQYEKCSMQVHVVAVVISFFFGTQSRRRRLAFLLPRLLLGEDCVLTFVEVYRRVESCLDVEF